VLLCEVTDWLEAPVLVDDEADDDVPVLADVSSLSPESSELRVAVVFVPVLALAVVWVVAVLRASCQASTPPSESMAAMLSAVAALRARAARGLRRGRPARLGVAVVSPMAQNVRMGVERAARAG
jgi:hypothetical protein